MQHGEALEVLRSMNSNALAARAKDEERLEEEQEELTNDPEPDTAWMVKRLERKIKAGSIRIDAMETIIDILEGYKPAEDVTYGDLEFRPNGEFYIERLKASTFEYWPFRVESYEDKAWRVIDHTTDIPMGIIRPGTQNEAWKVTVNGQKHSEVFTNLKGAVIFIINEFNG